MPPLANLPPMTQETMKLMDQKDFPRNMLSNQFRDFQLPASIKTWGQLKQYATANPQMMPPEILNKLQNLQKFQYFTMLRSMQMEQQNQGLGGQPPPGQQQPGQQQPLQAQQQMQQPGQGSFPNAAANQPNAQPNQMQRPQMPNQNQSGIQGGSMIQNGPIPPQVPQTQPLEIQQARQRVGQSLQGFSDQQLGELIRRKKWAQRLQQANAQKAGQGGAPIQNFPGQFGGLQFNQVQPPPQQPQPQQQPGSRNTAQNQTPVPNNVPPNQAAPGAAKSAKRTPNDPSAGVPTPTQQQKRGLAAPKANEVQGGQPASSALPVAGPANAQAQNNSKGINRFGKMDEIKKARMMQLRAQVYRAPLRQFNEALDANTKNMMKNLLREHAPMMLRAEHIPQTLFCFIDDNEDMAKKLIMVVSTQPFLEVAN